ncbi:alpha/beta hydrolase-fold protein [Oceanobacillus kimchii]|uniref:alpha/beta hydrolase-fold protein n=1 Tax=Oceanobacillus kimchii TaxID=746691 RepID=UPI003B01B209
MILRSSTLNKLVDKIKNQNTSEFWDEIESLGTPLIEETDIAEKQLVTFLYKEVEPIKNVVVISGPAGMDYQRNKMEKIPNTDIWFRSYLVDENPKFQYLLSPNDPLTYPIELIHDSKKMEEREASFIMDPLNKFPYPTNEPMISTVGLSKEDASFKDNSLWGKVEEFSVWSECMENNRNITLYLPKYCEQERKLSLVTILDGDLHPHILPALHIIDQLINNKNIKPVAVLLVHNAGQREKDMGCNNKFATFLSEELTSYLEKEKGLIFGNENCICGFNFGGIASLYTTYQYPTVYKNTIMVSTSLYWSPNDFKESEYLVWYMSTREKREISIYLECGKMENHSEFQRCFGGASNLLTNRHLRNVLTAKEYSYSYYEFNGGHDFIQWIDSLRRGLMNFYG